MSRGPRKGTMLPRMEAQNLRTALGRSTASQRWLVRQLNDPYVTAARAQGWRSRAAFKLLELDDRFRLIRRGARVVDLGAAPGGWTQVALARGAAQVVALDLLEVAPIPGATLVVGDFSDEAMPDRLRGLLGGGADLVLSDMAPNTTGHAATDHVRIMALAEMALAFAIEVLAPEGSFVAKVFQGGSERQLLVPMKRHFASVRTPSRRPAARNPASSTWWRKASGCSVAFPRNDSYQPPEVRAATGVDGRPSLPSPTMTTSAMNRVARA